MSCVLRSYAALTVLILTLLCSSVSPASAEEITIEADNLDKNPTGYILQGNVHLVRGDVSFRSDSAQTDAALRTITGDGGIILNTPGYAVTAERGNFSFDSMTGVLYNATLELTSDPFVLEAERLSIEADERYVLNNATVTTCRSLPRAWCIKGSTVTVLVGEYITTQNTVLRVHSTPVLYSPWAWAPIITERRTGLLPPTLGYTNSTGYMYSQPWFWAMADNRDATITLDAYSGGAQAQELEYRYVEGPGTYGHQRIYHMSNLQNTDPDRHFYVFTGRHRMAAGQRTSALLSLDTVNYEEFPRLHEPYLQNSSERFLQSHAEVSHRMASPLRATVSVEHRQDLKEGVSRQDVLQPRAAASVLLSPVRGGAFVLDARLDATRFERTRGPQTDRFNAGVHIGHTAGETFVLQQRVGLGALHYANLRTTASGASDLSRDAHYKEYVGTIGMDMAREFEGFRHIVTPSLTFHRTLRQSTLPDQFYFDHLEYSDPSGRGTERSELRGEVMNRMYGSAGGRLTARLRQPWDLLPEHATGASGAGPLELALSGADASRSRSISLLLRYNHEQEALSEAATTLAMEGQRAAVEASQSYARAGAIEGYALDAWYRATAALRLEAGVRYDRQEESGIEEAHTTVDYSAECWGVAITYVYKPGDYSVFLDFSLLGILEKKQ